MSISPTAVLLGERVSLGEGATVEEFVVLGKPRRGMRAGDEPLEIGAGATIRSHTVIYAGSTIGASFQTGHGALIREGAKIGDECSVGSGAILEFEVTLGDRVRLHSNVFVPEYSVLEDGCWLGPNVVLTNARYPAAPETKGHLEGVTIERGAKLGANVTVLPGVRVGAMALIGAGAVVTRDVEAGKVMVGNPARVVGDVASLRWGDGEELLVYPGKVLQ